MMDRHTAPTSSMNSSSRGTALARATETRLLSLTIIEQNIIGFIICKMKEIELSKQ